MQSSPSRGPRSRSNRTFDREHKRPKRYSLRIELLDDDDDDEVEQDRNSTGQPSRLTRGTSTPRRDIDARQKHPQRTGRRSRRASVSSTTAVVGDRNLSSTSVRPPLSEQGRREGTTSSSTRPSRQGSKDHVAAADLSEAFNQHMSMRDRDEADLPQRFERQMSIQDVGSAGRRSGPNNHRKRGNLSYKHAYAQTDIRGLEAHIIFAPLYPAPIPNPLFTRSPASGGHPNAEVAAYNNGFFLGRQLASAHILQPQRRDSYAPPPPPPSIESSSRRSDAQPPQSLRVRRSPPTGSSSPRSISARDRDRDQFGSSKVSRRKRPEDKHISRGWHFRLPSWSSS
ncbi:hypothetical protein F4776DRAFT_45449 [Hypoxylon sp. NC0597]|nr:hypothetical protein F4776DRAFT_45449 [Hypoxylon sp. NC0597]